jgi:hypothetical protein
MALSITHSTVVTVVVVADDGTSPVGSDEWNDDHVVTGTPDGVRELLTADRTYYVRTDGSDSNTGLANTSGGAFLTIQKAMDVIASTLDLGGKTVTVQVGNGTYTGGMVGKACVGQAVASSLIFLGDETTPANVVVTAAGPFVASSTGILFSVRGFKLGTTDGVCLSATFGGVIEFQNIDCADVAGGWHFDLAGGGKIINTGNYTISGGALFHMLVDSASYVLIGTYTVTLTGTPAFTAFSYTSGGANSTFLSTTFSGAATGSRYDANLNGVINTFGGGATYLPGDSAGSTATGGQYV